MNLDLDSLEALEAVVRLGSFTAAAKELGKAQSAVSYGIRQLEERLNVTVFDRSGHRNQLTEAGKVILEEGRHLLGQARHLEALAKHLSQGWEPRLEVVLDGILPMEPIMRVLKQMADEDVPTRIQVKVAFLRGVQRHFEADKADLMLVKDHDPGDQYEGHPLPSVECILVAGSQHALATAEGIISQLQLQAFVELSVHDPSDPTPESEAALFGGSRVYYLSDFSTKKQALLMGLGFGWMPEYLVREELADGRLSELNYEGGSRYSFIPTLVHPVHRPLGRAGTRFLTLLTGGIEEVL